MKDGREKVVKFNILKWIPAKWNVHISIAQNFVNYDYNWENIRFIKLSFCTPKMHQNSPTSICNSKIFRGLYPRTSLARWKTSPAPSPLSLQPRGAALRAPVLRSMMPTYNNAVIVNSVDEDKIVSSQIYKQFTKHSYFTFLSADFAAGFFAFSSSEDSSSSDDSSDSFFLSSLALWISRRTS